MLLEFGAVDLRFHAIKYPVVYYLKFKMSTLRVHLSVSVIPLLG